MEKRKQYSVCFRTEQVHQVVNRNDSRTTCRLHSDTLFFTWKAWIITFNKPYTKETFWVSVCQTPEPRLCSLSLSVIYSINDLKVHREHKVHLSEVWRFYLGTECKQKRVRMIKKTFREYNLCSWSQKAHTLPNSPVNLQGGSTRKNTTTLRQFAAESIAGSRCTTAELFVSY